MGLRRRAIRGQVALVTGAARGIGFATAERLLREGVKVGIADRDELGVVRAVESLKQRGDVRGYVLDVTDPDAFARVVGRLQRELGEIDILVNNAGIMPIAPFLEHDAEVDRLQLDVNVHGVIHGMRAALPAMIRRRKGTIVNIASVAGRIGTPYISVYCAAKHAVIGLTEAVRQEYGDAGIHFAYVCPALVQTDLISGTGRPRFPKPLTPEDVAKAVVVRAIQRRQVDVYTPRFTRLSTVLPAIFPRPVYERIGKLFGLADMFSAVDEDARKGYRERILG